MNCSNTRTHQVYCGRGGRDWSQSLDELLEHAHTPGVLWTGGRDWSQSLDELLEHAHTPGVLWTGRAGPESVTGRTARTRAHTRRTVDGEGVTGVSHWTNCSNTRIHRANRTFFLFPIPRVSYVILSHLDLPSRRRILHNRSKTPLLTFRALLQPASSAGPGVSGAVSPASGGWSGRDVGLSRVTRSSRSPEPEPEPEPPAVGDGDRGGDGDSSAAGSSAEAERRRSRSEQCPKITILLGCQSGKLGPQEDDESGKCGMNYIYVKHCGDFSELWLWWRCYDSR